MKHPNKTVHGFDPLIDHPTARDAVNKYLRQTMKRHNDRGTDHGLISVEYLGDGGIEIECRAQHTATAYRDAIYEILIEVRLATFQQAIMQSLIWKFSSPGLTSMFRSRILAASPDDNKFIQVASPL